MNLVGGSVGVVDELCECVVDCLLIKSDERPDEASQSVGIRDGLLYFLLGAGATSCKKFLERVKIVLSQRFSSSQPLQRKVVGLQP